MVINTTKKDALKGSIDVSKIVKTSFNFTIEEVLASKEYENKPTVNYITKSYYNTLEKLDKELSNAYHMGRNYEALTKKELLLIISSVLTKTPDLYYDTHKLITVIEDDYFIGVYETNAELEEYLNIINTRDLELMEG
tara:strand:+ start:2139 stop:2552 length:414 start_codon:yes stop_codon:yes gene_type:complete